MATKTMNTVPLGGVSPVMPSYSDLTPSLRSIPNVSPSAYGSLSSAFGSAKGSPFKFGSALGALGVGANLFGSYLNWKSAKNAQDMQMQMFKQQLDFNSKEAEKAFQRESAFNSEVAQVQRMNQAGLNPALMFKGADSVNSSAASASSVPDLKYPLMDTQIGNNALSALTASTDLLSKNESNMALINQLNSLTRKYGADSHYQGMLNDLLRTTFNNEILDRQLRNAETKVRIENYLSEMSLNAANALLAKTNVANYAKELGIRQDQVVTALKSALISASATKYAARQSNEGVHYSTDKYTDVMSKKVSNDWILTKQKLSNDFEINLKLAGIEESKARSMTRYFESQADLNSIQEFFYPATVVGSFLSSGLLRGISSVPTISGFSMSR